MKSKPIILLTVLFLLILFSCRKAESPIRSDNIEFGDTSIDSVSYFTIKATSVLASTGGNVITQHGHCWSSSPEPTIDNNKTTLGEIADPKSFTSELTELSDNTTYYIRAYVTYGNEIKYSKEVNVITTQTGNSHVTTANVSDLTYYSATCGGVVLNDSGYSVTARGVCWDKSGNPTLEDCEGFTEDGSGIGEFSSSISGLSGNIVYYVAAYAINENGTSYGNTVSFRTETIVEMITVEGGTFQMGNNDGLFDYEKPEHTVTLNTFRISKFEITNSQFCEFLNDIDCPPNGSYQGVKLIDMDVGVRQINYSYSISKFIPVSGKDKFPVIEVTWFGATAFSEWAGGRLPTEAEWEFAARGGNKSMGYKYSGSNDLEEVAWYKSNSGYHSHEVGTKKANELGIHDMSGNVWEWCNDWYDENYYSISPENSPQGPSSGSYRVRRGGSWVYYDWACSVTDRTHQSPNGTFPYDGFRLAQDEISPD